MGKRNADMLCTKRRLPLGQPLPRGKRPRPHGTCKAQDFHPSEDPLSLLRREMNVAVSGRKDGSRSGMVLISDEQLQSRCTNCGGHCFRVWLDQHTKQARVVQCDPPGCGLYLLTEENSIMGVASVGTREEEFEVEAGCIVDAQSILDQPWVWDRHHISPAKKTESHLTSPESMLLEHNLAPAWEMSACTPSLEHVDDEDMRLKVCTTNVGI